MPIVDIEIVSRSGFAFRRVSPQALADALGKVFAVPPGRTWVRLRMLEASRYAENESALGKDDLPAFVTILHAHPPEAAALGEELAAVTGVVARLLGRSPERVHVQYAPAAAGRQAFGGNLVR